MPHSWPEGCHKFLSSVPRGEDRNSRRTLKGMRCSCPGLRCFETRPDMLLGTGTTPTTDIVKVVAATFQSTVNHAREPNADILACTCRIRYIVAAVVGSWLPISGANVSGERVSGEREIHSQKDPVGPTCSHLHDTPLIQACMHNSCSHRQVWHVKRCGIYQPNPEDIKGIGFVSRS